MSTRRPQFLIIQLLVLLLVTGCRSSASDNRGKGISSAQPGGAERRLANDRLCHALLEHERTALERDPELVAEKFARMARTPFAFFRGTSWFSRETSHRFTTPASSQIAVLGDPHPENVGTFANAQGELVLEFNDFDLAHYGSYLDDVTRFAEGLWIVAAMANLERRQRVALVEAMVNGYVAEVQALSRGEAPVSLRLASFGHLEAALEQPDDDDTTKSAPARPDDEAAVREVLAAYPQARGFDIERVTRRTAGIASFTNTRFRVVLARSPDDHVTLEIKESTGQPAQTIVGIEKQFHGNLESATWLGWAPLGPEEFRIRRVSPSERRFSARRLAKQMRSPSDGSTRTSELAFAFGRLLARGHCTALDRDGKPGVSAIVTAIEAAPELKKYVVSAAEQSAEANEADLKRFREELGLRGAQLGWTGSAH